MKEYLIIILLLFLIFLAPTLLFIKNRRWNKKLKSQACPKCKIVYGTQALNSMVEGTVSWRGSQLEDSSFDMNKAGSYSTKTLTCTNCGLKTKFNEQSEIIKNQDREPENEANLETPVGRFK